MEIEIVSSFNYLGVVLSSGGSFIKATNTLAGKALRALNCLFTITRSMQVPTNIMFNLFDTFVLSILNYASEIWGFSNAQNIERVHRKFCKWFLNVKMSTNNLSLYAEPVRFPLSIGRHIRAIKYWLSLQYMKQNKITVFYELYILIKDTKWKYYQLSQIGQIRLNHYWNVAAFVMSGYIRNLLTQMIRSKPKSLWAGHNKSS